MKRTSASSPVLAALVFLLASTTRAQLAPLAEARIRVETDLVTVPTSVLDAQGKPVVDLPKSAFRVFDNGVKQKIDRFEMQTNRPLELVLMVDSSLSTDLDMKFEREAAAKFIGSIVQPRDLLSVFEFSDNVYQLSDFSSDVPRLEAAAERITPGAGTSLYDAVVLGSEALERLPRERRRVIVLVTDAGETTSTSTYEMARHAAIQSGALLYTILIRPVENENGRNTAGEHALETIIDSTGGAMYYPLRSAELPEMFSRISRELRTQYLLSYYPEPKAARGTYCHIVVKIPGENYTLHYRKGYFAAGTN